MEQLEREQKIQKILQDFKGMEPLKTLFWSELNYERINQPLSRNNWNQSAAAALSVDPILFAAGGQNNDFHIIYCRLPEDKLLLGQERPVVNQLLKDNQYGLFIFSNQSQTNWHFINVKYDDDVKKRRLFRRISIGPEERLRTAAQRINMLDLNILQPDMFGINPLTIQSKHDEAFNVEAVTKLFFDEYKGIFKILENDLKNQTKNLAWAHDYSLQFLNRCMFMYFIQRKGWLGNDHDFLVNFWKSYRRINEGKDLFFEDWLKVLFFEAFNDKFHGGHTYFSQEIKEALSMAPFLNGGLFKENELDKEYKFTISDKRFEQVLKFLERYNFTITEDSPLDKEVAVDPEMIGKVYESLVNVSEEVDERGEAGIFYTPRTEIDMMCRLALVDNLANYLGEDKKELLNQLVFALEPDEKVEADKVISNAELWLQLDERLKDTTVLDPACGSGSFLVGMLNIIDDLQARTNNQLCFEETGYERKKRIIGQTLYGVDVMDWACHVAELRLWLALIIDAEFTPEELHVRNEPLLPHFSFKIRCGDSLVQEVGGLNFGHIASSKEISPTLKGEITKLKNEKLKFYNNDKTCAFTTVEAIRNEEKRLFSDILAGKKFSIQERIKKLNQKLQGPQSYQIGLDGKGSAKPHQMDLEADKYRKEIEALTFELSQTESAIKALGSAKEAPFVWDIAFVEIFEDEKEGFDIVIGNPPYVNYKAICNPNINRSLITVDNTQLYKANLAKAVYCSYPYFFGYKKNNDTVVLKLDARSDLYIYFYFRGLSLLNNKGSFCFITSNSWLDVDFGVNLQEFLLKCSHIKLIIDNENKRSFKEADVNTVIVLLSAANDKTDWGLDKITRFVMFKVPFEHIVSPIIFDEIEETEERVATQEYRLFPIGQDKLLEDGYELPEEEINKIKGPLIKTARYIGNKWGGKYLRAPDIFWVIISKGKDILVPLSSVAYLATGVKEGGYSNYIVSKVKANVQSQKNKNYDIIKDTSAHDSIKIEQADSIIFGGSNAVIQKCNALKYPILWLSGRGYTHKAHLNPHLFPFSGNYIGINPKRDDNTVILNLLLNSTFVIFNSEILGRSKGIGGAACVFTKSDLRKILILNPNDFNNDEKNKLLQIAKDLNSRNFMTIFEELGFQKPNETFSNINPDDISLDRILKDRRELDRVIFEAIGLNELEQLDIYKAVISLVKNRAIKAKNI